MALGIGAIIGAGLFSLTGIAAADNAGPAVVLSFVVAAIGCAFAGMCYSEFATMIPIAGSAYTYAYATMGELLAWIIGWDLVLEYAVGAATVSVSWSSYVVRLLHMFSIDLPSNLTALPVGHRPGMDQSPRDFRDLRGISILLMIGISESARVNAVIVVHQGDHRDHRDLHRLRPTSSRRTTRRSFPRTPASSANSESAASCAARR
jgi:APA family basic amino acid/polyamine antiporter